MNSVRHTPVPDQVLQEHDENPVHLTDLVQPHGVVLVLEKSDLTILKVSQNSHDFLGRSPQHLLGQALSVIIESDFIDSIQHCVNQAGDRSHYLHLPIATPDGPAGFDASLHVTDPYIILELEPAHQQTVDELMGTQHSVAQSIATLRSISDLKTFLQAAVEEIQALTGYDRVMIYQFDEQQAGSVVAEIKPEQEVSYLGLRYPATDIPKIVRDFYQQGMVRSVPDLTASLVELVAVQEHEDIGPMDLSRALLRGVDPCCVEYHQNMGVVAFLVIALVRHDTLWGLISCHHPVAKTLPPYIRSACEVLGQLIAAEVTSKVHEDELSYLSKLKSIQSEFVSSIAAAQDFKQALIHPQPRLLDLVKAQGAAVCMDQDVTLIGSTPTLDQVHAVIDWSLTENSGSLFHTDCLSSHYSTAVDFKENGSGVLILTISQLRRYLILWFRPEVIRTVNWAGNPQASIQMIEEDDEQQMVLCPRNSFEKWQETVEATSRPWKDAELENALDLKNAIVGIVLNKADELAQINLALADRNRELDSFAYAASHDLKEPLRGITNFANIIVRRYADTLDEAGVQRLQTLVRLAQRMDLLIDALLKFSRLGQAELNYEQTDLNGLVQNVISVIKTGREGKSPPPQIDIPNALPTVDCDPVLFAEVFSNLINNAVKYTNEPQAVIEIGCYSPEQYGEQHPRDDLPPDFSSPIVYVRDNGIGIRERHFDKIFRLFKRLHERDRYGGGSGVGLTIAQRIIERHGGQIWVKSTYGEGTTFFFTIRYNRFS